MKAFETIARDCKTSEEIYSYFDALPEHERIHFYNWLYKNYPNAQIDWYDLFEETREYLPFMENIKACEEFVRWFPEHDKKQYLEKYEFIERDLCLYYLYCNDIEKLSERIELVIERPITGIETLTINLFNLLIYYGHYDIARSYAESIFESIENDDTLFGTPHLEIAHSMYYDRLQEIYIEYKQSGNFNHEILIQFANRYDFVEDPLFFTIEKNALVHEFNVQDILNKMNNRKYAYNQLMTEIGVYFLKYMHETYALPFKFSNCLWNLIHVKSLFKKSSTGSFFYLDKHDFDWLFDKRIDYNSGSNFDIMFGKIWGLHYIYEFFEKSGLMPAEEAFKMHKTICWLRNDFIKYVNDDLWKMSFIFSWPCSEQWEKYKPLFASTFDTSYEDAKDVINTYFRHTEFEYTSYNEQFVSHPFTSDFGRFNTPYVKPNPEIGRNDLCPCGSGKKYKKCCMK